MVVVDPAAYGVGDSARVHVGREGPFGRQRVVFALPLEPGPCLLSPPHVVGDPAAAFVADAQGALIGKPAVWVSRMQFARWVEDTRRF